MGIAVLQVMIQILFALCFFTISCCYSAIPHSDPIEQGISAGSNAHYYQEQDRQKIIDAKGGPEDVVWVVQLSDLHFSVHHPERASDFRDFVGSSLSFVNPSLVLITGDLTGKAEYEKVVPFKVGLQKAVLPASLIHVTKTALPQLSAKWGENDNEYGKALQHVGEAFYIRRMIHFFGFIAIETIASLSDGKSKDLLTMKQDEAEWVEYEKVMQDVIEKSGLNKDIFYDLRGNHDAFGVPSIGSLFDFFSKHSINGQLGRSGQVNSVTVQTAIRKILFVGFDSTMSVGLRGPTNLFGHPTDELLAKIDYELSQWDSEPTKPVTKISFGHFPLSFSAASDSGKTLRDTFLKHSISAYLCGHLHTSFGKNLKRHHYSSDNLLTSKKFFQLNPHKKLSHSTGNCSNGAPTFKEFWEWEMGDWRKSRNMRILAVDRGFLSFVDIDFKLGGKKMIILPTFPLDSRIMEKVSSASHYKCKSIDRSAYSTIRTLVFSASPVVSVVVRIYDSRPGNRIVVLESSMKRHDGGTFSRGDLYLAPWNFEAFEDPSPDRYWLQIEATDIMGRSTLTALRPFSINGLTARLSWTWKEFMVMGCQLDALYYPILWSFYLCTLSILIIPKLMLAFSQKHYSYRNFIAKKSLINGIAWVFKEFYTVPLLWLGIVVYLFYLLLCPWLLGEVFTEGGEMGFMTFKGWVVKFNKIGKVDFIGVPDIMVVVFPHLFFVILPSIFVTGALTVERGIYRDRFLSLSGKKEDDHIADNNESGSRISSSCRNGKSSMCIDRRLIRNIVLVASLAIFWKHFKSCRMLVKAYDMNPFLHFPVYCLTMPVLLAYVIYKTGRM